VCIMLLKIWIIVSTLYVSPEIFLKLLYPLNFPISTFQFRKETDALLLYLVLRGTIGCRAKHDTPPWKMLKLFTKQSKKLERRIMCHR